MKYFYKEYVHICNIDIDKSDNCRFLLEYYLDDGDKNKKALVIMKNPSKADEKFSDQTINTVLEYMHNFQYSTVYIMNLIPKYGTDSNLIGDDLSKRQDILSKNDKLICYISEKVSKIFVAWGGNGGFDKYYYSSRIEAIKKCLKERTLYCYSVNKSNKQPRHPSRNQWKKGKSEDDFIVYK